MSFILNINTGVIHNGESPCWHGKKMIEASKQFFDKYEEAVNFFNGKQKGRPCGVCLKDYDE